jgi:hypothetical protein
MLFFPIDYPGDRGNAQEAFRMAIPFFSKDQLWARIRNLSSEGKEIPALKFDNFHTITTLNEEKMRYLIRFRSMKEHELRFDELYVLYEELYRNGWMDGNYLSKMCRKLYNRPYITNGPAMMAVLYQCDRNLLNENGLLRVRDPPVMK